MKKSKLVHGRAAIAKKLAALTRAEQANKAVVPNLRNQVHMLQKQGTRTAIELREAQADAKHSSWWCDHFEGLYLESHKANAEYIQRIQALRLQEYEQRLTIQDLRRELKREKQRAEFILIVGTIGWIGLAVQVFVYGGF